MCTKPQQNHAEEGDISVEEVTGHNWTPLCRSFWTDLDRCLENEGNVVFQYFL